MLTCYHKLGFNSSKLSLLIVTERLPDQYYAAPAVAPLKFWPKA
jgi:hypothetical protein